MNIFENIVHIITTIYKSFSESFKKTFRGIIYRKEVEIDALIADIITYGEVNCVDYKYLIKKQIFLKTIIEYCNYDFYYRIRVNFSNSDYSLKPKYFALLFKEIINSDEKYVKFFNHKSLIFDVRFIGFLTLLKPNECISFFNKTFPYILDEITKKRYLKTIEDIQTHNMWYRFDKKVIDYIKLKYY